MARQDSERNAVTLIYLFLGDIHGALTVHGVVGEVVRKGFGSIPHRITCDTICKLWKSEHKMKRTHFQCELQPVQFSSSGKKKKAPSGW